MGSKPTVTVVPDPDALADAAARLIAEAAADAIEARGRFMWALAGGETPRATYARLALPPFRERVDWRRVWVFFGDERAVPPDHPDSNYRMAHETLLGKVPIPAAQVLRIRGEAEDLEVAAAEYAGALGTAFGTRRGELPRFDLVLLGMGVDGHTASLFPGSPRPGAGSGGGRRRALLAGHLRRVGRPDAAQAHARPLEPLRGACAPRAVHHHRDRTDRDDGRRIPRAYARGDRGIRSGPAALRGRVGALRHGARVCRRRSRRRGALPADRARAEGRRGGPGGSGEPALLLCDAAEPLRRHHREPRALGSGAPGDWRLHADHRGEAVRARLRERPCVGPAARERLPRGTGLPDRPLPRQGNGAEHPRVPLRQRHLRAAVEPEPCGRGPGDRGRVDRRRDAWRVLRGGGGAPRHDAESPAPAPLSDRHGAPGDVRRGPGARREEQGHARDPADRARAGLGIGPARPVRPRLRRGQAAPWLPPGEGRRARLEDRDLRRAPAPRGQLAVGGRAVLPAHGQAPREARERDRDPVPPHAAPDLPSEPGGRRGELAGDPDPARRGHGAHGRREDARARLETRPPAP